MSWCRDNVEGLVRIEGFVVRNCRSHAIFIAAGNVSVAGDRTELAGLLVEDNLLLADASGAGLMIRGAEEVAITDCAFLRNRAAGSAFSRASAVALEGVRSLTITNTT